MRSSVLRRLLAAVASLLVIAPTISGWAHDQAHHVAASGVDHPGPLPARSGADHDHDPDDDRHSHAAPTHDHGLTVGVGDRSVGSAHADSEHQADRIGSGVSSRAELAHVVRSPVEAPTHVAVSRLPARSDRLDQRPDQTHHPPSLPRGPPSV